MKYRQKILVSLVTGAITTFSSGGLQAETLIEAMQIAVNRSPAIRYSLDRIASADSGIGEARSGWLPNVSVNSGKQVYNSDSKQKKDPTYSVRLEQMLFDFGKTGNRIDYAKYNRDSEVFNATDEAEITATRVAEIYINILKYQAIIENSNANKVEHLNILQLAKIRAKGGVDSLGDVEQVEVRIKGLEAEQAGYTAQLEAAINDYVILVGRKPGTLVKPDLSFLKIELTGEHLENKVTNSPRIESLRAQKNAASEEYNFAKKGWLPQFSVAVASGKMSSTSDDDTIVSLNVTGNVFDGGGTIYRSRGAAYRAQAAKWNVEKSIENLSTKVSQLYQEALSFEKQLTIYAQRIIHSQAVKTLYHEQYRVNRRSVLDLLNAEQEFFQTYTNKINAEFSYQIMLLRVLSEIGMVNSTLGIHVNLPEPDMMSSETQSKSKVKSNNLNTGYNSVNIDGLMFKADIYSIDDSNDFLIHEVLEPSETSAENQVTTDVSDEDKKEIPPAMHQDNILNNDNNSLPFVSEAVDSEENAKNLLKEESAEVLIYENSIFREDRVNAKKLKSSLSK